MDITARSIKCNDEGKMLDISYKIQLSPDRLSKIKSDIDIFTKFMRDIRFKHILKDIVLYEHFINLDGSSNNILLNENIEKYIPRIDNDKINEIIILINTFLNKGRKYHINASKDGQFALYCTNNLQFKIFLCTRLLLHNVIIDIAHAGLLTTYHATKLWNRALCFISKHVPEIKKHFESHNKNIKKKRCIPITIELDDVKYECKSSRLHFMKGPVFNCLYGMSENIDDEKLKLVYDDYVKNNNFESIKLTNPDAYNYYTYHIRKNFITLHKTATKKCCIPKSELSNFVEGLKRNYQKNKSVNHLIVETFEGNKVYKFKIQCPCLTNIKESTEVQECSYEYTFIFNPLIDAIIHKYTFLQSKEIYSELESFKNSLYINISSDKRITPKCPSCACVFTNEEGLNNLKGNTPIKRHPSDVICPECNYHFCTDCDEIHPGKLCNGFNSTELEYTNARACPKCKTPTYRTEGCAFMQCTQCIFSWCWACRCIRNHEDDFDKPHYCILTNRFQSNPRWYNNSDVSVLEEIQES
jgi:hypothetical protein